MRHSKYATENYNLCNVKYGFFVDQAGYDHDGALMSRDELGALTGTLQPKRMCAWLESRGWVYEPPARRGDIPKVLRAYRDARLSGIQPGHKRKANYSFMTAGLL
jgi:hypothetical protein